MMCGLVHCLHFAVLRQGSVIAALTNGSDSEMHLRLQLYAARSQTGVLIKGLFLVILRVIMYESFVAKSC